MLPLVSGVTESASSMSYIEERERERERERVRYLTNKRTFVHIMEEMI
jgi:hypothetical protein